MAPERAPLIRRAAALPEGLAPLRAAAAAEGFRFLERLAADWAAGANRFDGPGEALFFAHAPGGALLGLCGLNRDPWAGEDAARLRRLYVAAAARRRGVGAALVAHAIAHAQAAGFARLRLRTDDAGAASFYEALGFARVEDASATHALDLRVAR